MIDSHAHLTDERFTGEVEAVLERARQAGLEAIVTVGTGVAGSRSAADLAARYPAVYASAGMHPHDAHAASDEAISAIREIASEPRVVAIGETGLDYHYDFSPRDAQRSAFARQLRLGAELGLPVIVHAREADEDVAALLREHGRDVVGVLHSFTGGAELLQEALELGWYVSFAGMITFKNYGGAELVRAVPAERILVETDSPYLTPVPFRGKRNEPAHVTLVTARAAELRGESMEAFALQVTGNARRFYRLGAASMGAP